MLYSHPGTTAANLDYQVTVTYHDPSKSYVTDRSVTGFCRDLWPEFWALVNAGPALYRSSFALTVDEIEQGCYVVSTQPGDEPLPSPASLSYWVEHPTRRSSTPNYLRRLRKGEVLMNDYSIGREYVQKAAIHDTRNSVATGTVWNASAIVYNGQSNNYPSNRSVPCAYPSGGNANEVVRRIRVLPRYRVRSVPNARILLSPDLVPLGTIGTIEPSVVTAAVAARNAGTIDILTEFAELPETLSFMRDKVNLLGSKTLAAHAEAGRLKKAVPIERLAKALSKHWLEYRYAVMPIIYTVIDISETLQLMKRLYAEFKESSDFETQLVPPAGVSASFTGDSSVQHRCLIRSRYSPDSLLSSLASLCQFNLASTAWELTPGSFIADWVINFGDTISAVTGVDTSDDSKCCYSWRDHRQYQLKYTTGNSQVDRIKTTVTRNTYERLVINPMDHIGLSLKFDMGWKRQLDAIALSLRPMLRLLRSLK